MIKEQFNEYEPNEEQPLIQKRVLEGHGHGDSKIPSTDDSVRKSYMIIVISYVAYSLNAAFTMAVLPPGKGWRSYSWHPLLMVLGVIGMMGVSLSTKKLGGYKNTKLHGIMSSTGLFMAFGGFYAIYKNKELHGKSHFTSLHSVFGLVTLAGFIISMLAGIIFLHPDVGIATKDTKKRFVHKWFGRTIILIAWITCFLGLKHSTRNIEHHNVIIAIFAAPLVLLAPLTLI